jgi:hypothetical protein
MMRNTQPLARVAVVALCVLGWLGTSGAAEIRGKVITMDGQALPGATVKLFYSHDGSGYGSRWLSETTADGKGNFTITKPDFEPPALLLDLAGGPMCCCLVCLHPGYWPGIRELIAGEDAGYVISLQRGRDITCTVIDLHSGDINLICPNPVRAGLAAQAWEHLGQARPITSAWRRRTRLLIGAP